MSDETRTLLRREARALGIGLTIWGIVVLLWSVWP
jgi:hypothetical protein